MYRVRYPQSKHLVKTTQLTQLVVKETWQELEDLLLEGNQVAEGQMKIQYLERELLRHNGLVFAILMRQLVEEPLHQPA